MSKETNLVIAALATASDDIPSVTASCTNDMYNSSYVGLSDLLATVKPILQKHGLWASYGTRRHGSRFRIEQRFHHLPSGQHYGTAVTFDLKSGAPHEIASLMTYGRRYLLQLALNLSSDIDDDGNAAQRTRNLTIGSKPSTTLADYEAHLSGTQGESEEIPPSLMTATPSPQAAASDIGSSSPPSSAPIPVGRECATADSQQPDLAAPMHTILQESSRGESPSPQSHISLHDKPRINTELVQRGQLMASLYARFKQLVGKGKAESVLQDIVGTTYIRFVTPEKYGKVIDDLTDKLSQVPAA